MCCLPKLTMIDAVSNDKLDPVCFSLFPRILFPTIEYAILEIIFEETRSLKFLVSNTVLVLHAGNFFFLKLFLLANLPEDQIKLKSAIIVMILVI